MGVADRGEVATVVVETRWSAFFFPGQRAEIEVSPDERYASRVEDVGETTLALAMPLRRGAFIRLRVGTPILLQAAKRNNWYFFRSKIVGNSLDADPIVLVERPPDNSGEQLRAYARMDLVIDNVQLWVEKDGQLGPTMRAIIVDLSAGGAQVLLKEPLDAGDKITVRFKLPRVRRERDQPQGRGRRHFTLGALGLAGRGFGAAAQTGHYGRGKPGEEAASESEEITLDGDVLRVTLVETVTGPKYRLGVRWESLTSAERERLIRYTLQWELEMRRRGVL